MITFSTNVDLGILCLSCLDTVGREERPPCLPLFLLAMVANILLLLMRKDRLNGTQERSRDGCMNTLPCVKIDSTLHYARKGFNSETNEISITEKSETFPKSGKLHRRGFQLYVFRLNRLYNDPQS